MRFTLYNKGKFRSSLSSPDDVIILFILKLIQLFNDKIYPTQPFIRLEDDEDESLN